MKGVTKECVGIELATRIIVGHFLKEGPICSADIVKWLQRIVQARKPLANVGIIHSDNEAYFEARHT